MHFVRTYRYDSVRAVFVGLCCAAIVTAPSAAQQNQFIGPPGGTWFDPAHWSLGTVPGAQTPAVTPTIIDIDQPGAVAATLTATGNGGFDLLADIGATLTTNSQSLSSTTGIAIARQFGGVNQTVGLRIGLGGEGQYLQYGGSLQMSSTLMVGTSVLGPPSAVTTGGDGLYERFGGNLTAGTLNLGYHFQNDGTFRQHAGTTTLIGAVELGYLGGHGTMEIFGGSLSCASALLGKNPTGHATVVIDDASWSITGSATLGEEESSATVTVRYGGVLTAQSMAMGLGSDGFGRLNVEGANSEADIAGNITGNRGIIDVLDGGALECGSISLGTLSQQPFGGTRITVRGKGSRLIVQGRSAEVRGQPYWSAAYEPHIIVADGGRLEADSVKIILASLYGLDGVVAGDVINLGACRPGETGPATPSFGTIEVEGDFGQTGTYQSGRQTESASGALFIEIGGEEPSAEHDVLKIGGALQGAGELVVTLVNDFDPPIGSAFDIGEYETLIAPFATLSLPQFKDDREVVIEYIAVVDAPDILRARVQQRCVADIDGSGGVDVDDLISVILSWGACPAPPATCEADVNSSGAVDVDDLIAVILGWGACP